MEADSNRGLEFNRWVLLETVESPMSSSGGEAVQ